MAKRKRKGINTVPASSIERQAVEWLWREHIPWGKLSLIAGWPEKGKSMLMARIAADISQEYPVIMSMYEDDAADTTIPRLEAAGANVDNVHLWDEDDLRFPHDLAALRDEIYELGVAAVFMDPAASHTSRSIYNATAIREAFGPLKRLANETEAAFILTHHIVKRVDLKADPLAAVGGAGGGLGALVRVAYLFGDSPDDEDERCLVQLKCNIAGPRPGLKFEMDTLELDDEVEAGFLEVRGTHQYTPSKVFTAKPSANLEKVESCAEWLVANLREGPMPSAKLLEACGEAGFTKRMVNRVVVMMEIESSKGKWKLPEWLANHV